MTLPAPHFLINFKAYDGTAADAGLGLVNEIAAVSQRTGASFVVAPQLADLSFIARQSTVPLVAQVADVRGDTTGNGRVPVKTVAECGGDGLLLNHPECEIPLSAIEAGISACEAADIDSIVCVNSIPMGRAVLEFSPEWLLFERPSDIASGESMAETAPERVKQFLAMVTEKNPQTQVMLGGGISNGEAVEKALTLGADAAGAASAFVDADERKGWLAEVAHAIERASSDS